MAINAETLKKFRLNIFKLRLSKWRTSKDKSYIEARKIWLLCYDKGEEVPPDILKVFVEGIRKYTTKYEEDKIFRRQKNQLPTNEEIHRDYIIYRFANVLAHYKGKSIEEALNQYLDFFEEKQKRKYAKYKNLLPPKSSILKRLKEKSDQQLTFDDVKQKYYRVRRLVIEEGEWWRERRSPWL